MQEVLKDPIIILIFILFFGVIIGFIIYFLVTYQRKQLIAKVALETLKQTYETQLAQTKMEVQEQTFQNIASELHDNIGQLLSLTNITLSSVDFSQANKTEQKVNDARELVTKSIKELRHLSKIVQGEMITQHDLLVSFRNEVDWLQKKGMYTVELISDVEEDVLQNKQLNLFVYRLLQECLNNIIKHAKASEIKIYLNLVDDILNLTVRDNGIGFDPEKISKNSKGIGLSNFDKRVALLNGTIEIDSLHQIGTTIKFKIPYQQHAAANS